MKKIKRLVVDAYWITAWLLFHVFIKDFSNIMPETELQEAKEIKEKIRILLVKENIYQRKRKENPELLRDIVCAGLMLRKNCSFLKKEYNQWLEKLDKPQRVIT